MIWLKTPKLRINRKKWHKSRVLQYLSPSVSFFFRQHVAWTIQYELPGFVKTNKSVGHHPLPAAPNPGRNGCQRRRPPAQRFTATGYSRAIINTTIRVSATGSWLSNEHSMMFSLKDEKTQLQIQQESEKWSWGNKLLMIFKLLLVSSCFNPSMQNISIITELLRAPQSWRLHLSLDSTIWKFDLTHQSKGGRKGFRNSFTSKFRWNS